MTDQPRRIVTLALCSLLAFLFVLGLYAWKGGNPMNRLGYAVFMSVVPGVIAFIILKAAKVFKWYRAAVLYVLCFAVIVLIQMIAR